MNVIVNVCGGVPTPGDDGPLSWGKILREGVVYYFPEPEPVSWLSKMLYFRMLIRVKKDGAPVERAPSKAVPRLPEEDLGMLYGAADSWFKMDEVNKAAEDLLY